MLSMLHHFYSPKHCVCGQILKTAERVMPVSSFLPSAFSIRNKNIFPQSPGYMIIPKYKGGWESKYLAGLPLQWKGSRKKGGENDLLANRGCHSGE